MSASSLSDLVSRGLPGPVAAHARDLLALQARLDRELPAALAGHVRVMQLDQKTLSLACESGAVAGRLRREHDVLLERLRMAGLAVEVLRVTVDPGLVPRYVHPVEKPGVPVSALDGLAALNASIEDGPLKQALDRLLRHHRRD